MSREEEHSAEESAAAEEEEEEVVRVLNNVLSSSGMCIKLHEDECGVRVSKEVLGTYEDGFVGGWYTFGQLLLGDDNCFSMFEMWTYVDKFIDITYLHKHIAELGMRSLAGCKSFTELELKVRVMFPDA